MSNDFTTFENNVLTLRGHDWRDYNEAIGQQAWATLPALPGESPLWRFWLALGRRLGIDFTSASLHMIPVNRYTWRLVKVPPRMKVRPEEYLRRDGIAV